MRRPAGVTLIVAALAAAAGNGAAAGDAIASAPQVRLSSRATALAVVGRSPLVRGETVRVAVEVRVGDGYHVNANPPTDEFLIPTAVTLADTADLQLVDVFYPDAQEKLFAFWPGPLRVWEGSVVIGALLRVTEAAALGPRDLRFNVRYQACNDEACFAPADAEYDVPVEIVAAGTPSRAVKSPLLERARFEAPTPP